MRSRLPPLFFAGPMFVVCAFLLLAVSLFAVPVLADEPVSAAAEDRSEVPRGSSEPGSAPEEQPAEPSSAVDERETAASEGEAPSAPLGDEGTDGDGTGLGAADRSEGDAGLWDGGFDSTDDGEPAPADDVDASPVEDTADGASAPGATAQTPADDAAADDVGEPRADQPVQPEVAGEGEPIKLTGRNDGDAIFVGILSALASGSGLAAVAGTAFVTTYVVTNVFRLGGYTFTSRYWQWGVGFVVVPTLLSLFAIPVGSAFGTWWGAGLRGLPLPLVDAVAFMVIGLSLGTLAGTMIAGPPGVLAGGVVGTWLLATGAFDYVRLTQGFNTAAAIAWLGAPAIGGVAAALVGSTVGAAIGPVLIASHWAGGAKAAYFDEE